MIKSQIFSVKADLKENGKYLLRQSALTQLLNTLNIGKEGGKYLSKIPENKIKVIALYPNVSDAKPLEPIKSTFEPYDPFKSEDTNLAEQQNITQQNADDPYKDIKAIFDERDRERSQENKTNNDTLEVYNIPLESSDEIESLTNALPQTSQEKSTQQNADDPYKDIKAIFDERDRERSQENKTNNDTTDEIETLTSAVPQTSQETTHQGLNDAFNDIRAIFERKNQATTNKDAIEGFNEANSLASAIIKTPQPTVTQQDLNDAYNDIKEIFEERDKINAMHATPNNVYAFPTTPQPENIAPTTNNEYGSIDGFELLKEMAMQQPLQSEESKLIVIENSSEETTLELTEMKQEVMRILVKCLARGPRPWENPNNVSGKAPNLEIFYDKESIEMAKTEIYALLERLGEIKRYSDFSYLKDGQRWTVLIQPTKFLTTLADAAGLIQTNENTISIKGR